MGIYQSSHQFVEPIAFGFEDESKIVEPKLVVYGPIQARPARACRHCVLKTKKRMIAEDNMLRLYRTTVAERALSKIFHETAEVDMKSAQEMLDWARKRYRETNERPRHVKQQLKDAYNRRRQTLIQEAHCRARVLRKERAVINLKEMHEKAQQRTLTAMNKQLECARK